MTATAPTTQWRNRIVRYGEELPDQLLANAANWRVHPASQQDALLGVVREVGLVQDVIVNLRTSPLWPPAERYVETMVDGHLRVTLALREPLPIPLPVKYVDLTPAEEALVLATFDPLSALAVADKGKLDELLQETRSESSAVQQMLANLAAGAGLYQGQADASIDEQYSRKITSPVYEPANEKPPISTLYDDTKTKALIAAIEVAEGLTDAERAFLTVAARRHTVLHYGKIADYYAHADASLQRLMEDSALVIIDFNRAIELGFVRLAEEIAMQYGADYGND